MWIVVIGYALVTGVFLLLVVAGTAPESPDLPWGDS